MDSQISHEQTASGGAFILRQEGRRVAEMTYSIVGDARVVIDHTFVDPGLRGGGVARRLLDAAAAWARATNTKVVAGCSYVTAQFARDQSLRDIMA